MAANPIQAPVVDVPRHVWDAVNNAIHTSKIDGSLQPISLCYVAVRAALAAYVEPTLPKGLKVGDVWETPHGVLYRVQEFTDDSVVLWCKDDATVGQVRRALMDGWKYCGNTAEVA